MSLPVPAKDLMNQEEFKTAPNNKNCEFEKLESVLESVDHELDGLPLQKITHQDLKE